MNASDLWNQLPRPVRYGLRDPTLLARKGSQLINKVWHGEYYSEGTSVLTRDWDNLIVLDGCRYDLFADTISWDKRKLTSITSRGSATDEWLVGNFKDAEAYDTVYVSANPMLHRMSDVIDGVFHDFIDVWTDSWDQEHGTVLPSDVTEAAIAASEQYPNKRLIIHYLQPHYPFLAWNRTDDRIGRDESNHTPFWMSLRLGDADVSSEQVYDVYRKNLEMVLPHAKQCADTISGKTVTTSDHGNLLGERTKPIPAREWGHPQKIYADELVTVPWFEHDVLEKRKNIVAEAPTGQSRQVNDVTDVVDERLSQLGYVE